MWSSDERKDSDETSLCMESVVHEVENVVHEVEYVAHEVEIVIDKALSDLFEDSDDDGEISSPKAEDTILREKSVSRPSKEKVDFIVLTIAFCTIFLSQNAMAPTLSVIAEDLGFSESARDLYLGAYLALALGVCSVPAAAALGFAADFCNRKRLMVAALLISAFCSFWNSGASTYSQIFLSRVLAGVAMGGALPVVFSLVGDLMPPEKRGSCSSALTAAMGAGVVFGQMFVGALAPSIGWRAPMCLLAFPNLLAAVTVLRVVKEPPRGSQEQQLKTMFESGMSYEEKMDWMAFWKVMNKPTNKILIWQGLPGSIPWGVICVFLNDFLSQEKGLSIEKATLVVGMFGVGAALGSISGGVWGQRIQNHSYLYLSLVMGISVIGGVIPLMYIINTDFSSTSFCTVTVCTLLSGFLASMNGANIRALLLNVNLPEARGTVMSVANLVSNFGRGIGPLLAYWLISLAGGRQGAINWALSFWGITGMILLAMAFTLEEDIHHVETQLEKIAIEASTHGLALTSIEREDIEAPDQILPMSIQRNE